MQGESSRRTKFLVHDLLDDWGAWTTAHFSSQEARDRFIRAIATLEPYQIEAQPVPDNSRSAQVRWHRGRFLSLNDIAYAHGGRIVAIERRGPPS